MKNIRIKSPLPLWGAGAAWLIMGLILPIYRLWAIVTAAAVSATAYFVLTKFFPGREIAVQSKADSGNAEVNAQIDQGRETLRHLDDANRAIDDEAISACIERMVSAGERIFAALEKDTAKAAQIRRFMNYYLPTSDKLLARYRELMAIGGTGENATGARNSIANSMEMIATAFEKQLDALYKDSALDIETEIEVLETVIRAEGHDEGRGMTMGGH
jgi:hypothetical protein